MSSGNAGYCTSNRPIWQPGHSRFGLLLARLDAGEPTPPYRSEAQVNADTGYIEDRTLVACHSVSVGWGLWGRGGAHTQRGNGLAPCTPTSGGSEGPGYPLGAPSEPPEQNQCGRPLASLEGLLFIHNKLGEYAAVAWSPG